MKKKHVIIFIIILYSNLLLAQNFSLGLKDGISWSGISGRYDFANFDQTQVKKRIGTNFGINLNYKVNSYFSLQFEINYEEKGFNFNSDPMLLGLTYTGKYRLRYLTIPVISCFEIGKNVKYYGYTGIYVGFLVNAENYTSLLSTSSSELVIYDLSYDPTEVFNKQVFGGLVGLGIKIPLCDKVGFIIDSRYNFGLTKAAKNTDYDYDPNHWTKDTPDNFQNVYNRSFSVNLGILYKLNNKTQ